MNDRYLSKAKRIDNEEWVEWYLIFSFTDIPYIVQEYAHSLDVMKTYEVDISTICRCTGLKDKNGNLIWENDIVETQCGKAVVVWDKSEWRIKWIDDLIWRKDLHYWVNDNSWRIEVIGNKFDNPELLEVEE
jgi:uncharacterized phage protein (TIGR01671 family)